MIKLTKNIYDFGYKIIRMEDINMGADRIIKLNTEHEADMLREKVSVYESVIDYAVAETVLFLEKENKTLNEQVNNLTGQLKVSNDTVEKMKSTYDKAVADIKALYNKMLQEQLNRQKKDDEAVAKQQVRDAKANEAKRVRNKEVIPLKAERDALVEQIDKTTRDTNEKVTELNETVTNLTNLCISSFNEILSILNNSSTIEEAAEAVDDIIVETKTALGIPYSNNRKPSKQDKIEFTKLVNSLSESGKTNKEIAKHLYEQGHPFMITVSTENAREQKVGRYLHKEY